MEDIRKQALMELVDKIKRGGQEDEGIALNTAQKIAQSEAQKLKDLGAESDLISDESDLRKYAQQIYPEDEIMRRNFQLRHRDDGGFGERVLDARSGTEDMMLERERISELAKVNDGDERGEEILYRSVEDRKKALGDILKKVIGR